MALQTPSIWDFPLDGFQRRAIEHFDAGDSVLVAAPTGSGKTVIAEHAISAMLREGKQAFYTSPIKALANQKFRNFCDRFGAEKVGLLTGDLTVRGDAPVVVMTTEVLRNMLYEGRGRTRSLGVVVLDEVHYLQDRHRGPVWEEVLLNLPSTVRTVSLSATVSNLDEFVGWLRTVRGPTALVVETQRPVPLQHLMAVSDRESRSTDVVPLLAGKKLSPAARRYQRSTTASGSRNGRGSKGRGARDRGGRRQRSRPRWAGPRRSSLSVQMVDEGLGPLIWFIFSRAGCDEAVEQCRKARLRFTTDEEADELAELLRDCTTDIDDDDWYTLALDDWQEAFENGIASHHAGLIPAVKEAVEKGFDLGLLRVVFATETLALGVNLPARSVVIEKLVKYNGETHEILTPLEFTQLTGRAGRRGLDDLGTSVVCWNARLAVTEMATLAASTDFPLRSAFAPNYNMVANLIRQADQESARSFVVRSYAQYQRDQHAESLRGDVHALDAEIAETETAIACEYGDVRAWFERGDTPRVDDEELGQLKPGDIFEGPSGRPVMAVSVAHRSLGIVVRTVDADHKIRSLKAGQAASPLVILDEVGLPAGFAPNDRASTKWAASEVATRQPDEPSGVSSCPQLARHEDALEQQQKLMRRKAKLERRLDRSGGRLVNEFDAVADILHERGYATDWDLTTKGSFLAAVHGESEAVLAEALSNSLFDGLDAPELAAVLSSLVYEPRNASESPSFSWPTKRVRTTCAALQRVAGELGVLEVQRIGRTLTKRPDPGLVDVVYRWATGEPLELVLDPDSTGGDFVRSMRQVLDLCRQVAVVSDESLRETASDAVYCIDRGVVSSARDVPQSLLNSNGSDETDFFESESDETERDDHGD